MNETGTQQRIVMSKILRGRFLKRKANTVKRPRKVRSELHGVSWIRHTGATGGVATHCDVTEASLIP